MIFAGMTRGISGVLPLVSWEVVSDATKTLVANHGYILDHTGDVTVTLPDTIPFGNVISIVRLGSGNLTVAQNALQSIKGGITTSLQTTVGVGGSFSTTARNSIDLLCTVANLTFVVTAFQGDITFN